MKPQLFTSTDAIQAINKEEINQQIATARSFPRDTKMALKKMIDLTTITPEVAEKCFYAINRGDKRIVGATIRLAEVVAHCWGNLRAGARIIGNDGKMITAQGYAHDLENNLAIAVEAHKGITYQQGMRKGETYSDEMQVTIANAVSAVAFRNTIFKVVPSVILSAVEEAIKGVIVNKESMGESLKKAFLFFTKKGKSEKQIFDLLKVKSKKEITQDDTFYLMGLVTAIEDGETTLEAVFDPPKKASGFGKSKMSNVANAFGNEEEGSEEEGAEQGNSSERTM